MGEASVLQPLSQSFAVVEGERTLAALSEAVRQKDALYRLADRLQQAKSRDEVYSAALHAIVTALPCDRASILLFDGSGTMRFVAWRGLSDRYRAVVEGHSPWSPDDSNPAPVCIADVDSADLPAELKAVIRPKESGPRLSFRWLQAASSSANSCRTSMRRIPSMTVK
jgi:hypothetical protein